MNETVYTLTMRKSCKSFMPEHITNEEMEQILSAGLNAPSGMNRQTPRFVAVRDPKTVKKLSLLNAKVLGAEIDPFYGAPDVIAVLAKKEATYLYDGSLAMGNLLNAAFSLGVGSCWIHRAKEVFCSEEGKALLKEWGITEEVEGIGFCVLGYPNKEKADPEIQPDRVIYVGEVNESNP